MKNLKKIILIPKLNNSGGVTEVIYLKKFLETKNCQFEILPLFGSKLFIIDGVFGHIQHWKKIIKESKKYESLIITHYTTLFFSLFINRRTKKTVFIQCLEWKVISKNFTLQYISKILHFICFMKVNNFIFANKILKDDFKSDEIMKKLLSLKKSNFIIYPVGHRLFSYEGKNKKKDIDILIILRNNWVKRYSLYIDTLSNLIQRDKFFSPNYNLRIINLSSEIIPNWIYKFKKVKITNEVPHQDLFLLYKRSKLLLYLSCYEGFGLPPLEAMSQGCIPIISNNRGQYNYLNKDSDLILKKNCDSEEIVSKLISILNEKEKVITMRRNKLIKIAENYYDFAENKRKKEIKNIVKWL